MLNGARVSRKELESVRSGDTFSLRLSKVSCVWATLANTARGDVERRTKKFTVARQRCCQGRGASVWLKMHISVKLDKGWDTASDLPIWKSAVQQVGNLPTTNAG